MKHLIPITIIFLIFNQHVFAQTNLKPAFNTCKIDSVNLPKDIIYKGNFNQAVKWKDESGENLVLLTETGNYYNEKFNHDNEGGDAEIFAYHFLLKNNTSTQTWRIYDFISDCPVDYFATFIKNSFQVTDLNHDGIAEIWVMYKKTCRGDVGPSDMKIIMYQGDQKFAVRGHDKVIIVADEKENKIGRASCRERV